MASQETLDKMAIRQGYSNLWHTDLMSAIGADPAYCCFSTLCPHCVSYLLRKRALYDDMSRYTCCGGYMPCSGKCGERKCPEFCLCTEVFLCFPNSVATTRFMMQDEFNIQTTQCDNCIIGFMFCLQQLACIFALAACLTGIDELEEASQLLSCLSDLVYCTVCSCMQTQHKVEMDKRDGKFGPRPIMAPPSPQHMSRIDQQPYPPPHSGYPPPPSGYPPPPSSAYPPPPPHQQMYGYPPQPNPYGYPQPAPGYPAHSSPGYPQHSPPGYPQHSPGYPPHSPGYAPQPPPHSPGYDPQPPSQRSPAYASQPPGYPQHSSPGYDPLPPPQHSPAYAPQPPGYPQHSSPGYEPQPPPQHSPAYASQPPGYPQHSSPGYEPQPPPQHSPAYAPQPPGYPQHSPGYPGPGADHPPPAPYPPKSDSK